MIAVGAGIHLDRRVARSGVTPERPLMKRENWTRDTPSCSAARVTVKPSSGRTCSFRMLPGCGGLYISNALADRRHATDAGASILLSSGATLQGMVLAVSV